MFEQLDFIYCPSADILADLAHYQDGLGAKVVWTISRFGTRVAMLELTPDGPALLLAEHLHGDQPVLLYRVPDLAAATAELTERGVEVSQPFGFPHGDAVEILHDGPQRVAIYELTRPERGASIIGRRDF